MSASNPNLLAFFAFPIFAYFPLCPNSPSATEVNRSMFPLNFYSLSDECVQPFSFDDFN